MRQHTVGRAVARCAVGIAVAVGAAAAVGVPVASAAGLPPLPAKLYGSFTGTWNTTEIFDGDMPADGPDTLTVHATNVVFSLRGDDEYFLTGGTATVTDSGYYDYGFDGIACPCEVKETYDPRPNDFSKSPLEGQFTVTPPAHGDSWDGASTYWVALSVPTLVTSTGSGTETSQNTRTIGPIKEVNDSFDQIPIKLTVGSGGDYSLSFSSSYNRPAPPPGNFSGGAETDTYSGLLTSLPADDTGSGSGSPSLTEPAVSLSTFTVTYRLGGSASEQIILQRRSGSRWTTVGSRRLRGVRGRNSVSLRHLFGAAALRRAGSYRVVVRVTGRRGKSTSRSVSFRVR